MIQKKHDIGRNNRRQLKERLQKLLKEGQAARREMRDKYAPLSCVPEKEMRLRVG